MHRGSTQNDVPISDKVLGKPMGNPRPSHLSQPHCISDLLETLIQLPGHCSPEEESWAQLLQRQLPQSRIARQGSNGYPMMQPNERLHSTQVVFYWSYQNTFSPVFKFIPRQFELGSALTAYAYVVSLLLPLWIAQTAHGPLQRILDHFIQIQRVASTSERDALNGDSDSSPSDPVFISKASITLQGLQYLRANGLLNSPHVPLTSIEWEAIFYLVNATRTKKELSYNLLHDRSFQEGLEAWQRECTKTND